MKCAKLENEFSYPWITPSLSSLEKNCLLEECDLRDLFKEDSFFHKNVTVLGHVNSDDWNFLAFQKEIAGTEFLVNSIQEWLAVAADHALGIRHTEDEDLVLFLETSHNLASYKLTQPRF